MLGDKTKKALQAIDLWHHGSRQPYKPGMTEPLYLARERDEAAGFAHGIHLGGKGNEPQIHSFRAKPGLVKNIDNEIMNAMDEGDDVGDAVERHVAAERTRSNGARYLEFMHPSTSGQRDEFTARVSLYPHEDLSHVGTDLIYGPKSNKRSQYASGGVAKKALALTKRNRGIVR